ncbi:hypothetical protein [Microbacterium sp. nov. GSS16]|uniref:hypothetical protein n=1 Tax=Microbacterium sp. nov. GSS16 TaxID=3019890 RepID=UPI002306AE59|nr:hypothetical protein [Microbacterium sp. nov. GSS16]WCD92792.1 hypothetical protein PGB26_00505 [Microbacterium sp. nov. GSS16]
MSIASIAGLQSTFQLSPCGASKHGVTLPVNGGSLALTRTRHRLDAAPRRA